MPACNLQVVEVVDALEDQRCLMAELQSDAGLGSWNDSLLLDLRFAGIVEAWAAGATWAQVRGGVGGTGAAWRVSRHLGWAWALQSEVEAWVAGTI